MVDFPCNLLSLPTVLSRSIPLRCKSSCDHQVGLTCDRSPSWTSSGATSTVGWRNPAQDLCYDEPRASSTKSEWISMFMLQCMRFGWCPTPTHQNARLVWSRNIHQSTTNHYLPWLYHHYQPASPGIKPSHNHHELSLLKLTIGSPWFIISWPYITSDS